jgi:hypothetical protein
MGGSIESKTEPLVDGYADPANTARPLIPAEDFADYVRQLEDRRPGRPGVDGLKEVAGTGADVHRGRPSWVDGERLDPSALEAWSDGAPREVPKWREFPHLLVLAP